jgi:gliding motility-associated-like protein
MDTVTIIDPYSVVEISKTAKSVKQNPDGTILVTFMMYAINKTDASIDSVSIKDDLTKTFNTSTGVVAYSLETFGGLVKNIGYDGIANIEMLDPSSKVAAKKTDSLILKVLLESPSISGTLYNQATLTGKTKYGKVSVISNDPFANPTDSTKRVPTSFVIPKIDVIVAGGFSPNQDGMNDKWIIIRPYGTKIQAKVFNRWGNLVYENDNYQNDWDGRGQGNFMGNFLPEGTYFYLVEAIDRNGNTQKFSKTLTIVR